MDQSLPPIQNLQLYIEHVGSWNLYDLEVRRVHAALRAGALTVEVEIVMPATLGAGWGGPPTAYETVIVFAFSRVESLSLNAFTAGDDIAEYECVAAELPDGSGVGLRFWIESHCNGRIIDLLAHAAAVASAERRPRPELRSA